MENFLSNRFSQAKPIFEYLKKQQENEKFIKTLEITATFLLIIFFIIFAIRPAAMAISGLLGDIESKKILKKELNKKINNIIQAQDQFSQVEGKYNIVNNSLPDKPGYFDAVNQVVNNCQGECNLGILNFDFESNKSISKKNNAAVYSINISNKGSFAASVNLASKILQNQRLANVESINFSTNQLTSPTSTSSATPSQLNTSFSTSFYYWPSTQ